MFLIWLNKLNFYILFYRNLFKANLLMLNMIVALTQEEVGQHDFFQYFEGGKEGVKRRIGERVRAYLSDKLYPDVVARAKEFDISMKLIGDLYEGDYDSVTAKNFDDISFFAGFTIPEVFGPVRDISIEERSILEKIVDKEGWSIGIPGFIFLHARIDL